MPIWHAYGTDCIPSRSSSQAMRNVRPHATAVFVPPLLAADAIIDAIEQEVPLIVSVAEGVPLKDQMRVSARVCGGVLTRWRLPLTPSSAFGRSCRHSTRRASRDSSAQTVLDS